MIKTLCVLFTAVVFSLPSFAAIQKFTVNEDQFEINVPKGWQTPKNFYGFPVSLMGPDNKAKQRTVIGIIPTGAVDENDAFKKGDTDPAPYRAGREKWVEKYGGKALSFDPYTKQNWAGVEEAHTLGYHYELPTGKFYERSVYVLCAGKRVYFIKTLVHSDHEASDNAIVDSTIKSLKCEVNNSKNKTAALTR